MNYYEKRINKISKFYIAHSILKSTWLYDNRISYCKPINDIDLKKNLDIISDLNRHNKNNEIVKRKLFDGLTWYAAYCSSIIYSQIYAKYKNLEFDDVLSYCLERLSLKLDDWDNEKSNNASFYTRYSVDVNYYIRNSVKRDFSKGICKLSILNRAFNVLEKIHIAGYTKESVLKLSDIDFRNMFGMSKKTYIEFLKYSVVKSGNTDISFDKDESIELLDTIKDDYYSEFDERIIANEVVNSVLRRLYKIFKNKPYYVDVWKEYKLGGTTLKKLSADTRFFKSKITRERVRQIIQVVDKRIAIMYNK